jgi:hypothetical protein
MVLVGVLGAGRIQSTEMQLYPLTKQQALDTSTLDPMILADRTVTSRTHPDRQVRWVKVRFFSHDWKDGPWHAEMTVAMPPKIEPDCLGLAAITLAGVGKKGMEPGFDANRDLAEATAMEFGIPVATMPQQGTHYGLTEIHELSDHLTKRFVETGDPSWLAAFPGAAVQARAVTMIGKLTGTPIHSVVHMGGSISAGQGWVWATFDERVKGLVASGSIGPFTKIYPNRPPRVRLRFLHEASEGIRELFVKHRDPISYARQIDCSVLIATGSNDRACPPAVMPEFVAAFRGTSCLATVPNGLHSPGTGRQAETFRMWIDHTLFDRPLSRISFERLSYESGRVTCCVQVAGEPQLRDVNLVWTRTNNPKFLATSLSGAHNGNKDNYTQARWEALPLTRNGEIWTATLDVPNPKPEYIACFVDVRDEFEERPGHVTTLIQLLPQERE